MPEKINYSCVLFDCDGVLVGTEHISMNVLLEMIAEHGLELDYKWYAENFQGKSLGFCLNYFEEQIGYKLPEDFEQKYRKLSFERFTLEVKAIDGIEAVLRQLTTPFGVVSNAPQSKVKHNLRNVGLLSLFEECTFSAYDIDKFKPLPDIYLHAANQMGFQPKDCIVVEDSYVGAKAGLAAGMTVFVYGKNQFYDELIEAGAIVIEKMSQLETYLFSQ